MAPTKKDHWWNNLGKIGTLFQVIISTGIVGGVVYSVLLWSITSWADDRYVMKAELLAAINTVDAGIRENYERILEAEIMVLQDDIVFFDDELAHASVRRYCRKLPRAIQNWEKETTRIWKQDPIVQNACRG